MLVNFNQAAFRHFQEGVMFIKGLATNRGYTDS